MSASSSAIVRWRMLRYATQALAFLAILVAPFLGGWQRLDRNYLAAWDGHGWDLPPQVLSKLPLGSAPSQAYDANQILGGGSAAQYLGLPITDPTGAFLSLLTSPSWSFSVIAAWLIPVLLGVVAGRVFCGWFCPFGSLARASEILLERLPFLTPSFQAPKSRPLRYFILLVGLLSGAFGFQTLLYFFLPYVLVQQSIYSLWLMGGGGAALGALVGLLAVGFLFGPTLYCATLCPTGAALALLGRSRRIHLKISQPASCGKGCQLCNDGCWLGLDPASGDAGPDCDLCGRCMEVCPKNNLQRKTSPLSKFWRSSAQLLFVSLLLTPAPLQAKTNSQDKVETQSWQGKKPRLVIEAHRQIDSTDLRLAIVDLNGVQLDADNAQAENGVEISLYLARGPLGAVDERGKMEPRADIFRGPLSIRILERNGTEKAKLNFEKANQPISTPHRSIYRKRLLIDLVPGDQVQLAPIEGWFDSPQNWIVPTPNAGASHSQLWIFCLATLLIFGGLLLLSNSTSPAFLRSKSKQA